MASTPHRMRCARVAAVLFDRDGTLIRDVPYNGDPALVEAMPTAIAAIRRLRAEGVRTGVVSNQSGVGRGWLTEAQVRWVNARVDAVFGQFDVWRICPHTDHDGCGCRKPAPGLVLSACAALGVAPANAVVVGDIEADVRAGLAAGTRAVLVPTPRTRPEEVARAELTAPTLLAAVRLALGTAVPQVAAGRVG